MRDSSPPPTVALVGAGRVATAVGILLQRAGHPVAGVGYRGRESTERAARRLGVPSFEAGAVPPADVILIGAPDHALEEVAAGLAGAAAPDTIVCHFAGSMGVTPLLASGLRPCALHPVQACPDVETALRRLPGSAWGVTCRSELTDWASDLVAELGGNPFFVAERDRPAWHAAAAITANGIAALLATAESMLGSLGVSRPIDVLGPLAAGVVANARAGGGGAATLTGPVVRGEAGTVRRHIEGLPSDLVADYRRAAAVILAAARRAGRVDSASAREIGALLEAP